MLEGQVQKITKYMLRSLRVIIDKLTKFYRDNLSVQKSCATIEKIYKKKYAGISFHNMREEIIDSMIALDYIYIYIYTYQNIADILIKLFSVTKYNKITNRVLK